MTITITEFKAKCLHLIRQVEAQGEPIDIARRGRVVARLVSAAPGGAPRDKPWQRLRGSGRLESAPGESALADSDFKALRGCE
ncbi:MAG: type II toxin-antitoxin system Phd/YefM family antitoxin [Gammaproteobacteria bacterium]